MFVFYKTRGIWLVSKKLLCPTELVTFAVHRILAGFIFDSKLWLFALTHVWLLQAPRNGTNMKLLCVGVLLHLISVCVMIANGTKLLITIQNRKYTVHNKHVEYSTHQVYCRTVFTILHIDSYRHSPRWFLK